MAEKNQHVRNHILYTYMSFSAASVESERILLYEKCVQISLTSLKVSTDDVLNPSWTPGVVAIAWCIDEFVGWQKNKTANLG